MLERLSQMNPIRPYSLLRRHYVLCMFLTPVQAYVHMRVCASVLLSIQISGVYFANSCEFTNIQISAKPESKLVIVKWSQSLCYV